MKGPPKNRAVERLAYSPAEAAAAAGVSRPHIYNEMARGHLRSTTLGRSRRILRDDLVAWLEQNRDGGNGDAA